MVFTPVPCPHCQSEQVTKRGKTDTGKQRYRCQNPDCSHQSFLLDPAYRGRLPEIKQQVIEMSLNGSGVRDTARVLKISTATVIHELKKRGYARIRQPAPHAPTEPQRRGRHDQSGQRGGSG
jgi:transposase-like protein